MDGRIQIDPNQLETIAKEFQAKRQESDQIIQTLKSRIQSLEGQWQGMTQKRFFDDFREAEKNMQNFTLLLDNISTALNQIAQKFHHQNGLLYPILSLKKIKKSYQNFKF